MRDGQKMFSPSLHRGDVHSWVVRDPVSVGLHDVYGFGPRTGGGASRPVRPESMGLRTELVSLRSVTRPVRICPRIDRGRSFHSVQYGSDPRSIEIKFLPGPPFLRPVG